MTYIEGGYELLHWTSLSFNILYATRGLHGVQARQRGVALRGADCAAVMADNDVVRDAAL